MDSFEKILKDLPEKPARSRLAPYGKLISELLRHGRTYRDIARIPADNCQVKVSISTIHDFVRLWSRAKRNASQRSQPQVAMKLQVNTTGKNEEKEPPTIEKETLAADEVYRRIAALKSRQAPVQAEPKRFHFDANEPLHLTPKTGPGKDEN